MEFFSDAWQTYKAQRSWRGRVGVVAMFFIIVSYVAVFALGVAALTGVALRHFGLV